MYLAASLGAAGCGASDASTFAGASNAPGATNTGPGGAPATGVGAGGHAGATTHDDLGGGGAGAVMATPFAATGSLDFVVTKVDVSQATGPTAKIAPSMGAKLRIDLPDIKAPKEALSAIVTPRWGEPTLFSATITPGAIELSGSATIKSDGAVDTWQKITIALGPGGKATGLVTVSGQESVFSSGVGYSAKIAATGLLGPDVTAPQSKPAPSLAIGEGLLPWEALGVTFAEPIAKGDAAAHLTILDAAGTVAPFSFLLTPDVASGAVTGRAYAANWDGDGALTLHVAPGYVDAAGNAGDGFDQAISLLAIPKANGAMKSFDGGDAPVSWGAVKKLGASDGVCETSSCVVIGPFSNAHCGVPAMGFAVRLASTPSPATKVRVRYRALYGAAGANGTGGLVPLSVQVARPGAPPIVHELTKAPSAYDLGAAAGDFSLATPWTTLEVALPSSGTAGSELGVAVRAGAQASSIACTADAPPDLPAPTKVVVEWVGAAN